ncbi:tetratricopeptide repeat protein [Streptomyces sp. NPDC020141]|uniref:tetratricopeptide repeat protein n=1 Tax=Streptomyces sp. NPDC020141 TaxID=3365065 RepID=UPI0037A3105B
MGSERRKNAAVATLVTATLAAGVIAMVPRGPEGPRPAPGPAARARAAAAVGAPAALPELNALIAERERWLRGRPGDEESWAVLGTAYAERGARFADWDALPRAERALRRSLELVPAADGNTEALLGLAALAGARQDFRAARDHARQALKQRPRRWTVHRALIDAYSGLGDYKAVAASLEKLTGLYAGPQARGVAARVYRDKGWREDAAATAYDAVAAAEGVAERAAALHRFGDLDWERGEPAEAIASYDLALRLDPGHRPALASRARALAALGRTDEALRDYRTVLERGPSAEYALEAGELYESLGLGEEAGARYAAALAAARRATAAGVNQELPLGRYEADHGDPEEAVRRLSAEWERGRRGMETADALGWALFRAGRAKEALPYAKRATKEGLRSPLFSYHRGEIERALGLYGPARRDIGQALRINPYFSPLLAPAARAALTALGEPPAGGPRKLTGREGAVRGFGTGSSTGASSASSSGVSSGSSSGAGGSGQSGAGSSGSGAGAGR